MQPSAPAQGRHRQRGRQREDHSGPITEAILTTRILQTICTTPDRLHHPIGLFHAPSPLTSSPYGAAVSHKGLIVQPLVQCESK